MGTYVNNNRVSFGASIDYDNAVQEIAGLLAVGTRSDGAFHLADICQADSINMMSKKKPVRSSATANTATTYKADGWCGFDVSEAIVSTRGDVSGIADKITRDGWNGWKYAKPRGVTSSYTEWNRLRDFNGYNHAAVTFVQKFSCPESWALQGGEAFNCACMYFEQADDYNLTQFDLPIKDYYFGVALISGSKVYRMTNSQPISETGFSMAFQTQYVTVGLYNVYPFISTRVLSVNDSDVIPATIYTIPRTLMRSINIVQSQVNVTLNGYYNETMTQASYTVKITNGSGGSITFNNNYVRLRYANKDWNDVMVAGEKEHTIASFTLAAGASRTFTGTFTGFATDLPRNSQLMASFGTGTHRVAEPLRIPASPTSL